jgi:phosphoribosylformimino-5-aminoimidazole carboxamide ribotide isomerase
MVHVVDLDGALTGKPKNSDIIIKIAKTLRINIEVGGGIREEEDIKKYLKAEVRRVILSTSAIASEEFLKDVLEKYKEKIIIGVDAKDGYVAAKGWKDITNVKALDFIRKLEDMGVKRIIYTDIRRDGVMKGPNIKGVVTVLRNTKMKVIVSGGVSRMKNIERLMQLEKKFDNLEGIIIGKALYTGDIDLKEAVKLAKDY